MIQFGSTLIGRADGKKGFKEILKKYEFPVAFDFSEVVSLGSSFGDEVILKVASKQDNKITVLNTNGVIKNSIRRIVEETSIDITFID